MCIEDNCTTYPVFNMLGTSKGIFCAKHKLNGMVNVKDKRCIIYGCDTISNYGYCGQSSTHCAKHKEKLMFIKPKRTCVGNDEEKYPTPHWDAGNK
jgi:hypothetical protein